MSENVVDVPAVILFLGQKWLGERCFNLLLSAQSHNIRIGGVVSNLSDNVWWQSNKIYQHCIQKKIPFIDNSQRNNEEILRCIHENQINTIISVQHSWILPETILSAVNFQAFNLHAAKLPEYKGYNSCNHAILNKEKIFTTTIHWMVPDVDMGATTFTNDVEIANLDSARSLYDKAMISGEIIFKKLLNCLEFDHPIPRIPLRGYGVFYPRNSLDQVREIINLSDFQEIDIKTRASFFPPFEPAYYTENGQKIYFLPQNFLQYIGEFSKSSLDQ